MPSVSIIGAGNLAYRFAFALEAIGYPVDYIYNRTAKNAEKLCARLAKQNSQAKPSQSLNQVLGSDVVLIAVADDAIEGIVEAIKELASHSGTISELASTSKNESAPLFVHCSGATDIAILAPLKELGYGIGVLYPLMTLSKSKEIVFRTFPFLIEAPCPSSLEVLVKIVEGFESEYSVCDSYKRLRLHTAAVFSCNFTNYLFQLAFEVGGNWSTYLIAPTLEMARKSFMRHPKEVSTGPAVRGDMKTINKHLQLLEELGLEEHKEIYEKITQNMLAGLKK